MNPLVMLLLQAALDIAKTHWKNALGGEVIDTTSFILDAAQAIDLLHQEENGQPLDWAKIREHQPLAPSGSPPDDPPNMDEALPETAEPGSEPVPAETEQPIDEDGNPPVREQPTEPEEPPTG